MAIRDSLIQVQDLKKYYNRGAIKALDGVTVNIDRGDVMVVIGPSGSGKSTFLRSLNLLEQPTGGSIIFDGISPRRKSAMRRANWSSWTSISTVRRWEWCFSISTCSPI